jgi:hypothetical protein
LDCTLLLLTFSIADMHCPEGSLFCAGYNNADGVAVETYSPGGGRGSSPRDIDMNQLPSTSDGDDEAVVSSPSCSIGIMTSNPSITTDQRDQIKWHVNMQLFDPAELKDMRGTAGGGCDLSSRRGSDDEADGSAATTRKKLRLSKEQSALLEESFKDHSTLNPVRKLPCRPPYVSSLPIIDHPQILLPQLQLLFAQMYYLFTHDQVHSTFRFHPVQNSEVIRHVFLRVASTLAEAKERLGKTAQFASSTSGGLVSKQKSQVRRLLHLSSTQLIKHTLIELASSKLVISCKDCNGDNRDPILRQN